MTTQRNKPKKGEDVLVMLLARGVSHVKAAKAAGVCAQTVSEYLHDPAFRQRIHELRNRFMDATCGQIIAMSQKAMSRLEELLNAEDARVRLGAIREWKSCVIDLVNQYDLAKRIEEVQTGGANTTDPQQTVLNEILERLEKREGRDG
jgi:hypothetical protein